MSGGGAFPLDRQLRSWAELNVRPFDKNEVHPCTRCRVITMNGVEVESILFQHQLARAALLPRPWHEETITLIEGFAERRDNPQLRSCAKGTIPTLREHRSHLKALAA